MPAAGVAGFPAAMSAQRMQAPSDGRTSISPSGMTRPLKYGVLGWRQAAARARGFAGQLCVSQAPSCQVWARSPAKASSACMLRAADPRLFFFASGLPR